MQTVSMLIKPATGRCNLRCSYCFTKMWQATGPSGIWAL